MARKPTDTPPAAASDAAAAEAAAKVAALKKSNDEALTKLRTCFGKRWEKIAARATRLDIDADQLASLAGKMLRTRNEWYPQDAEAALKAAAHGFLTALDMRDEAPAPEPETPVPATPEAPAAKAPDATPEPAPASA